MDRLKEAVARVRSDNLARISGHYAGEADDTLALVSIEHLRTILDAIPEWRGIESAPRDGEVVLIFTPNTFPQVTAAGWRCDLALENWQAVGHRWHFDADVTHWMPFPPPPAQETGG